MAQLTPSPKQAFLGADGNPLAAGKLYTYAAGTTTPLATYSDAAGFTANANPIILDARGEATIYLLAQAYKFVLKTSADATIYTQDSVVSPEVAVDAVEAALAASSGSSLVGYLPSGAGAVATTVQAKLREFVSVKDFGAVGNGITDDTTAIQAAIDAIPTTFGFSGGTLYFPVGQYLISDTLVVSTKGITLRGEGGNYFFGSANFNTGSILLWGGAAGGTMMAVKPPDTVVPAIFPNISGLSFDGDMVAGYGLTIEGTVSGTFEDITIRACTIDGLRTQTVADGSYSGLNMVHSCTFRNIYMDQEGAGNGMHLGAGTTGETTVCNFSQIVIRQDDGVGLKLYRAGTCFFHSTSISHTSGGTGIGIELGDINVCNSNVFFGVSPGVGGMTARASAVGNVAYGYLIDAACPQPTIETENALQYHCSFDAVSNKETLGINSIKLIGDKFYGITFSNDATIGCGIDFASSALNNSMMRYKNNLAIRARNAADTADIEVGRVNTFDEWYQAIDFRLASGVDILPSETDGTKIANANNQKVGFWGATPIAQPSTTGTTTGYTSVGGSAVLSQSTFTGNTGTKAYTIGDIVKALKDAGLIAAS